MTMPPPASPDIGYSYSERIKKPAQFKTGQVFAFFTFADKD